jgi:hypothetical protein
MGQVFTVDGLILRRPDGDPRLESRLEPDFKHPTDPLWEFSQGSAEWRRARSVLLQNGRGAQLNLGYADEMLDAAGELQRSIRSYLGQSGRTF